MSYLSSVEAKLPPGFRFYPRDDELICDYLAQYKLISGDGHGNNGLKNMFGFFPIMVDVDLNKCEPWDLPDTACIGNKEWYFFNLRDRKYATGQRTNRATVSGYWKATGKDRQVVRKGTLVGMRKTLVFYQGRAPKGKKTEWVMHEFRSESPGDQQSRLISSKEDWVLCRVFYKSRGMSTPSKGTNAESCVDDTGSSSLPVLPGTYHNNSSSNITFNQSFSYPVMNSLCNKNSIGTNATTVSSFEQVPCFSSFSPSNDLASTCLKYVQEQLSKLDSKVDDASSESYALSSSIWYPFQN